MGTNKRHTSPNTATTTTLPEMSTSTKTKTKAKAKANNTSTDENNDYRSVYVTIDPSTYDAGLERMKRAIRRTRSADDAIGLDLHIHGIGDLDTGNENLNTDDSSVVVPWYNVLENAASSKVLELLRNKNRKSKEKEDNKNGKNGKKQVEEVNPNEQLKKDFFTILNVRDPSRGCSGFNVSKVNRILDTLPTLACTKYSFTAFTDPIPPLHMLCAIDAPLSCIKKCYMHNRGAIYDTKSTLGSPIHYACYYNVNIKIIRYLCQMEMNDNTMIDNVLCYKTNRSKRTPLHIVCMKSISTTDHSCYVDDDNDDDLDDDENDRIELVQLLLSSCPNAVTVIDKNGMTPLHYALSSKQPNLPIIKDLLAARLQLIQKEKRNARSQSPSPSQSNDSTNMGIIPILHLALTNQYVTTSIIQHLLRRGGSLIIDPRTNHMISDTGTGNTPLHVAVYYQRPIPEIKLLLKLYPQALNIKNKKGKTPYKLAKSILKKKQSSNDDDISEMDLYENRCEEIVSLLKSISVV